MSALSRSATALIALGACTLFLRAHDARGAWPPPENADFTDTSNWPNDPGYAGRWNYWSFLPKQDPNSRPYLSADKALGASGMSVDKAWSLTTGRPDVAIAVVDSGIKWDSADLANKAWLNAAELKSYKPKDAQNQTCGGAGAMAGFDCNGDGLFTVADYADDARFTGTVAGEKCLAGMDPKKPTTSDRLKGDLNRNCLLDAGDLILMFSDGKDDDANGYTDDICGWDFYRNDNDAYDDTRYGHGTGEANDSVAEGNNMQDSIGTCPKCTFVPMRVGESFITDANEFAKAVIYAADLRDPFDQNKHAVKVVQEALGTINQTAFSKAAIDYAYASGITVDASMADENSRHHNLPAVANHTLPVHTIRYDGPNYKNSATFLAFDSCTNYGGHGGLSVSGTSCASEATGRMAGMLGLVYSMGLSLPSPLSLTAEEVMQIMKQSADDVDVPESRQQVGDTLTYYESKPGWDQRFNYGRTNAYRAVKMVKEGRIPPEVDIVSPTWYQPIFSDRVQGAIPIYGRIVAARATSYDYAVEWAPGVEPDDAEFHPLAGDVKNVPGMTTSGGSTPLASFDPRQLDTTHPPDPDSIPRCNRDKTFCWGPNDRTVTLRVRAIAHYGSGDVNGDARRTIAITNVKNGLDEDLLPGFPLDVGTSVEGSPKIVDVDGDGIKDLVLPTTDGSLHVWSLKSGGPVELPGFPFRTALIDGLNPALAQTEPTVPSYQDAPAYKAGKNGGVDADLARESIIGAPAVGDIDGDGKKEIVVGTWGGTLYVVDRLGAALQGWPQRLPLVPSCPLDPSKPKPAGDCMDLYHSWARGTYGSPVLADLDKDGKPEIVQAAFDGNVYVFKADGSRLAGWPVRIHHPLAEKGDRIMSTPAVGDFNGDGIPEIVTTSNEEVGGGGQAGAAFVVDGRGLGTPGGNPYLPNWPIVRPSLRLFPVVATGLVASPAVADFDGDGKLDVLIQGNGAPPLVVKGDPGKQPNLTSDPPNQLPGWSDPASGQGGPGFAPTSVFGEQTRAASPDTMFPLFSQPSIGDLDQDGTPDVVMSGGSLSLAGSLAGGGIARPFQQLLAAWSGKTGLMLPGSPVVIEDFTFLNNHAIADISGDDYPEMITGTGGYFLHAADGCGNEPKGWPKFTGGWIISTSAVGDLTGDGTLDVTSATRNGFVFAWRTHGKESGVVQWASFHHDDANSGNANTALGSGKTKAATPLVCRLPAENPPVTQLEAGGCSCNEAGAGKVDLSWLALLGLLLVRRRARGRLGFV